MIVAKAGGEEIDRTLGYIPTAEFIATVDGYHKGVGTLKAMLAEEPSKSKDAAFLYDLGEKLYAHNRISDADARYAKVVEVDPKNASGDADDALMSRVSVCQRAKDWDCAIQHTKEIPTLYPESELVPDAYITLAWVYESAGKKPEALAAYKDYITRYPEGSDVQFARDQIKGLEETPAAAY